MYIALHISLIQVNVALVKSSVHKSAIFYSAYRPTTWGLS